MSCCVSHCRIIRQMNSPGREAHAGSVWSEDWLRSACGSPMFRRRVSIETADQIQSEEANWQLWADVQRGSEPSSMLDPMGFLRGIWKKCSCRGLDHDRPTSAPVEGINCQTNQTGSGPSDRSIRYHKRRARHIDRRCKTATASPGIELRPRRFAV